MGAAEDDVAEDCPQAVRTTSTRRLSSLCAIVWLVGLSAFAILAPWISVIQDPREISGTAGEPPSWTHWLGTDEIGRDLLARTLYAARYSLPLALVAVALAVSVGGLLGLVGGYARGWLDAIVTWVVDVLLSFPPMIALMATVAFVGRGFMVIALVLGLLFVPSAARLMRAQTMTMATRDHVTAARVMQARPTRVISREILPLVAPFLVVFAVYSIAGVMVIEGGLSFLGLSVPPPTPTWGGMINAGRSMLERAPWVSLVPITAMFFTVVSLGSVAERLQKRAAG